MTIKILTLILTTSTMAIAQQQPSLKTMPPEILEQIGKRLNEKAKASLSETGDKTLLMKEGALYNNQKYTFVVKEVNGQFDARQLLGFLQKVDKLNKPNQPPVFVDLDVRLMYNGFPINTNVKTDEILDNILSRAQFFSKLTLNGFTFTEPQLEKIHAAEFKNLKELTLFDMSLTDTSLQFIAANPHFPTDIKFKLALGNAITDEGIKGLNISSLRLSRDSKITDAGLKILLNLISLELLQNNTITDNGLKNCPNLTSLILSGNTQITDAGLQGLLKLISLQVNDNNQITNAGLLKLSQLTSLTLIGNSQVTDAGLLNVPNLTSLLLQDNTQITDAGLLNVPNLTSLSLSGDTKITDAGFLNVPNLTSLKLFGNPQITDAGFLNVPNLTSLKLFGNPQITGAGFLSLKNLQYLELRGKASVKFSSATLEALRARRVVIVTKSW